MTDLTVDADPVPTASEVAIDDAEAHSGILRAAVYVASTISDNCLLDLAFQKVPVSTLAFCYLCDIVVIDCLIHAGLAAALFAFNVLTLFVSHREGSPTCTR